VLPNDHAFAGAVVRDNRIIDREHVGATDTGAGIAEVAIIKDNPASRTGTLVAAHRHIDQVQTAAPGKHSATCFGAVIDTGSTTDRIIVKGAVVNGEVSASTEDCATQRTTTATAEFTSIAAESATAAVA
jgi:hypothetical protein